MLFNSVEFWLFFTAVAVLSAWVPARWRIATLLVASCAFYMRWNASYIVLIAASAVVDYAAGRLLGRDGLTRRQRAAVLAASLATNLGLLFTFKYWAFFHDSVGAVAHALGWHYEPPRLELLLPVGISFYTFQTMSYTIDLYRGTLPRPERRFDVFALYVVFFPQLVAGPIERAGRLLEQLRRPAGFDGARAASGLQLALWGLFKKVVIADRLAVYVDTVYGNVDAHQGLTYLVATYAFAFQIYCDFSGYSDIAIGTARVLGVDLMRNFERPYLSTSIRDFWRRWHISLSTWLRDYLYVPIGGSRGGELATYRNLMITMLLGGLWHGASWNFVVWGGLQGLMLSASRATLGRRDVALRRLGVPDRLRDAVRVVACFHLVCLSWVFFRAETLGDAVRIVAGVVTLDLGVLLVDVVTFAHAAVGLAVLLLFEGVEERWGSPFAVVARWPIAARWAVWYGLLMAIVLLGVQAGSQFIYFQF
jgi:alginate O-acetyltransferase complex protein AlgI